MAKEVVGTFNLEVPEVLDDVVAAVVDNDLTAIANYLGSGKIEDLTHMAEIAYAALSTLSNLINSENLRSELT